MIIDDLKCCGNCKYRLPFYYDKATVEKCDKHPKSSIGSNSVCAKWKYDRMTEGKRKRRLWF